MESGTVWSEMTGTVWSEMGGTVWSVIANTIQTYNSADLPWFTLFESFGIFDPQKGHKSQSQQY